MYAPAGVWLPVIEGYRQNTTHKGITVWPLTIDLSVLEVDVRATPGEVRGEREGLRPDAGDVDDLVESFGVRHCICVLRCLETGEAACLRRQVEQ